jgi:DMSO/TMAO reductase YedYZ molybdopterin-dependent catalytic subunit
MAPIISRGFRRRGSDDAPRDRVPPGQYVTKGFPVLSTGPTPHTALDRWDFSIVGEVDGHCCIEPKGVLATAKAAKQAP